MGKCFCCIPFRIIKRYKNTNRKIVLLLAGLDNAGKTTAAKGLVGDSVDNVVPTVGFTSIRLIHRGYSVIIYDLGGGPQIRGIWNKYFSDVHGVIFVVDASDVSRIGECKTELEKLLSHEKLAGKPVLLLANKQDVLGAMDEIDIVECLCLEQLVNQQKCPTLVEICSAVPSESQKGGTIDPGLLSGYRWLLRQIIKDYSKLNARVEKDMKEEQERISVMRESWRKERDKEPDSEEARESYTNFFRPIDEVVKDIERDSVIVKSNFKTRDESMDSNQNKKVEVDIEKTNGLPEANGHVNELEHSNFTADIRGQLEKKGSKQRQKLTLIGRSNKVGPHRSPGGELPPLIVAGPGGPLGHRSRALDALTSPATEWPRDSKFLLPPLRKQAEMRPFTSRSLGNEGEPWGLSEDLEIVLPKVGDVRKAKSDDEDVVTG